MIKRDELTNPNSCMGRARDDEMTFVLLGRDAAAPAAIRAWVAERLRLGKNAMDDAQIVEALRCAKQMLLDRRTACGRCEAFKAERRADPTIGNPGHRCHECGMPLGQGYHRPAPEVEDNQPKIDLAQTADDRFEAVCGALGFHPETEIGDVIEAIQQVRSEARNYPNYQLKIEELERWKGEQQQALTKMSIACVNSGFGGEGVVEGVKWMEAQLREARSGIESALAKFNESDDERLKETEERYTEAEKWRKEGDMHGWNFHQGFSAGCTQASIIFFRVKRRLEELLAAGNSKPNENRLRETLEWYAEQARLCRLIHAEGDPGRHALSADGGRKAREALAAT